MSPLPPPHLDVGEPPRRAPALARISVAEYEAMIAAGILGEERRVALLGGILVDRMPTGSPHSSTVARLFKLCVRRIGDRLDFQSESRVTLGDSAPEPDLWIANAPPDSFAERQPTAAELLLVVEVADSSLEQDRHVELPLYAAAGIPEYWIVNLRDGVIERYTQPLAGGTYAAKVTLGKAATFEQDALGTLDVSAILR